jgi:hypothetical protein
MAKQDTKLESEGAEFLVLGNLLMQGIPAFKAYNYMKGYDIVALSKSLKYSLKIQVKSRWGTGAAHFLIKNIESNFIVLCRLNRGNKRGTREKRPPEYFIFPKEMLEKVPKTEKWGKIMMKDIPKVENYQDNWSLIINHLEKLEK